MDQLPAAGDATSASAVVIEFKNVGKTYRSLLGNSVKAVEEFSLVVGEGEILGIAGPNGAGKSTLISLMLGYLRPTTGAVEIRGVPARRYVERNGIGYLSELISINPKWRADSALVRYAMLAGLSDDEIPRRVDYVIDLLGLGEHRAKKVKALSKGNLQRLGLAQALLRPDERILVLDEPTHGLDPLWTQRFRGIVSELRRPDRTILIASHNLDELQRLADRVAIIDRGRLQRLVSTGYEPATPAVTRFRLTLAAGFDLVTAAFPAAEEVGRGEYDVTVTSIQDLNASLANLIAGGALIASVVPERSVLEQQFREAVGESE